MIAYRPCRGSLKNALKETRVFRNEYQMKQRIANEWNLTCGRKELNPDNIVISQDEYSDYKSGWQRVHDVCITKLGNRNLVDELGAVQCIGYCSYDISNAPKIGQWINVKNEMPDEYNPYVIGFSQDEFDVEIVGYEQDFGEWRDKNGKPHNITYWMPLPEPPVKY